MYQCIRIQVLPVSTVQQNSLRVLQGRYPANETKGNPKGNKNGSQHQTVFWTTGKRGISGTRSTPVLKFWTPLWVCLLLGDQNPPSLRRPNDELSQMRATASRRRTAEQQESHSPGSIGGMSAPRDSENDSAGSRPSGSLAF